MKIMKLLKIAMAMPFIAYLTAVTANCAPPINTINAKKFADNAIKINVNESSKEDAIALFGSPGIKSTHGDGEIWQYPLNTGGMPAIGYLHIKGDKIIGVEVLKTSMSGGGISSEIVYKKGEKIPLQ